VQASEYFCAFSLFIPTFNWGHEYKKTLKRAFFVFVFPEIHPPPFLLPTAALQRYATFYNQQSPRENTPITCGFATLSVFTIRGQILSDWGFQKEFIDYQGDPSLSWV